MTKITRASRGLAVRVGSLFGTTMAALGVSAQSIDAWQGVVVIFAGLAIDASLAAITARATK